MKTTVPSFFRKLLSESESIYICGLLLQINTFSRNVFSAECLRHTATHTGVTPYIKKAYYTCWLSEKIKIKPVLMFLMYVCIYLLFTKQQSKYTEIFLYRCLVCKRCLL